MLLAATYRLWVPPVAVRLARALARDAGFELEVGSLRGNLLGSLRVRGLSLAPLAGNAPATDLRIEGGRLEASYSLRELLAGGLAGLERVSFEADGLALRLSAGEGEEGADDGGGAPSLPAHLPELSVTLGRLTLETPDGTVLDGSDARVTLAGERLRATARRLSVVRGDAPPLEGALDVAGTLRAEPEALVFDVSLAPGGGTLGLRGRATAEAWELAASAAGIALSPTTLGALGLEGEVGGLDLEAQVALDPAGDRDPRGSATLVVRGASVSGRRVDELTARAALEDGVLAVAALDVQAGENRLSATDLEVPVAGAARDLADVLARARGRVAGELRDVPALLGRTVTVPAHAVDVEARLETGVLSFERLDVATAGGGLALRNALLSFAEPGAPPALEAELDVAFDDLAEVGRLVHETPWAGRLRGILSLSGPLAAPVGACELRAEDLVFGGRALGSAALSARVAEGRVELRSGELRHPAGSASLAGAYVLSSGVLQDARLSVAVDDLAALTGERLAGPARAVLRAAGPWDCPFGAFELEAPALVSGSLGPLVLDARGVLEGGLVRVADLRVEEPGGGVVSAGATLSPIHLGDLGDLGGTGRLTVSLERLALSAGDDALALARPAELALGPGGRVELPALELAGTPGVARGAFSFSGGEAPVLRASLALEELRPGSLVERFAPLGWKVEALDGTLAVSSGDGPTAFEANLSLAGLAAEALPETAWDVALDARLADELLELRTLRASGAGGTLEARGALPLALGSPTASLLSPGPLELHVTASRPAATAAASPWEVPGVPLVLAGELQAEARLGGSWSAPTGDVRVLAEELRLGGENERLGAGRLAVSLTLGDEVRLMPESALELPGATVRLSGNMGAPLDLARLVAEGRDAWAEAPLDAALELDLDDPELLVALVPALRRWDGSLEGRLALDGTVGAPRPTGRLSLEDGELRLAGGLPPLSGVDAELSLEATTLTIVTLEGELGAAPFSVEGSIDFGGDEPELALALRGTDLLLARTREARVRASADLRVDGPLSALNATGTLTLRDGRFGRNLDFFAGLRPGGESAPSTGARGLRLSFFEEPPLSDMRLDVAVTAERPFVFKTNVAQGELRPDLRIGGTGRVPLLRGPLYVDAARIQLPAGSLRIDSGLVRFTEVDPFVPHLDLTAESRMLGYDVRAWVRGPYLEPEIELSSDPPLPDEELLLLFLSGRLPASGARARGEAVAEALALYLAKDAVARWLAGDDVDLEETLLDRLELSFGADVSRSGAQTTRVTFYLDERPRGPGRVPYITGERDVYDKINFGIGWLFRFR